MVSTSEKPSPYQVTTLIYNEQKSYIDQKAVHGDVLQKKRR